MNSTPTLLIEDGIPLPQRARSGPPGSVLNTAVRALQPGQSVFTPSNQQTAAAIAHQIGKRTGARFTTRKVDGGVRVWRVS